MVESGTNNQRLSGAQPMCVRSRYKRDMSAVCRDLLQNLPSVFYCLVIGSMGLPFSLFSSSVCSSSGTFQAHVQDFGKQPKESPLESCYQDADVQIT